RERAHDQQQGPAEHRQPLHQHHRHLVGQHLRQQGLRGSRVGHLLGEPGAVLAAVAEVREQVAEDQVERQPEATQHPHGWPTEQSQQFRSRTRHHDGTSFRSPVSSKKTSSRVRSPGCTSRTSTPAVTSARTTAPVRSSSMASRSIPSARVTRSAPTWPAATSAATLSGSPRTSTLRWPRSSATVLSASIPPCDITPTRSQICSTSPSRWLESSTV